MSVSVHMSTCVRARVCVGALALASADFDALHLLSERYSDAAHWQAASNCWGGAAGSGWQGDWKALAMQVSAVKHAQAAAIII